MSFLIDTDTCSAALKGAGPAANRFLQYTGRLHISTVCVAELYAWVTRRAASPKRRLGLAQLLAEATVLPVTVQVAQRAGEIRASLLDAGKPIAIPDLLIAATAIYHDLILVTHNIRHFTTVPGLQIEDWLAT